jgi:hypothetical protein
MLLFYRHTLSPISQPWKVLTLHFSNFVMLRMLFLHEKLLWYVKLQGFSLTPSIYISIPFSWLTGSHYVDQLDRELTILLSQAPKYKDFQKNSMLLLLLSLSSLLLYNGWHLLNLCTRTFPYFNCHIYWSAVHLNNPCIIFLFEIIIGYICFLLCFILR